MATPITKTSFPPQRVNLTDIVGWLRRGDYIVLHNVIVGRFFHTCHDDQKTAQQIASFLCRTRIIYIDVSTHPDILIPGAWNLELINQGFHECTCSLKDRVSSPAYIPQVHFLKLGY